MLLIDGLAAVTLITLPGGEEKALDAWKESLMEEVITYCNPRLSSFFHRHCSTYGQMYKILSAKHL